MYLAERLQHPVKHAGRECKITYAKTAVSQSRYVPEPVKSWEKVLYSKKHPHTIDPIQHHVNHQSKPDQADFRNHQ